MKKFFTLIFLSFFTIISYSQLTGVIDYQIDPFCFGMPIGEFQISASGGTPPYSFSVVPGGAQQNSVDSDTELFQLLGAGTYTVTITDGTAATHDVIVVLNEPPPLVVTGISDPDTCNQCVGLINAFATGGTPPYLYSFDGGASWSASNLVTGRCANPYSIQVQDANGCTSQTSVTVFNTTVGGGSAIGSVSTSPAYCNDGSLVLTITGGNGPFQVDWNTGDTLPLVNNASAGTYTATVTDAGGCQNQFQGIVADSSAAGGCSTISGNVYADIDNNCADNAESGINYMIVKANPGNYVASTDLNGDYSLNLPYGTYDVDQYYPQNIMNYCGQTYNVTTSAGNQTSTGNDFADSVGNDYESYLYMGILRPIFTNYQTLYSKNHSMSTGDAMIYYVPDPTYTVSQTTPTFDYQNGDTLFWSNVTISSMSQNSIQIQGSTTSPAGSMLHFCHGVIPVSTDSDLSNNELCDSIIAIASYDPNDKQVFPSGDIELTDETLTYQIRFQNTGTDTAFNVFIMDTLTSYLDASTFEFVGSSHSCVPEIINNNILKFTFANIMLPDSNVNEPASHGHVIFRIKQNPNNQVGDLIENFVGIYFDFNEAVITNTVSSLIVQDFASVTEFSTSSLNIYPNPAKSVFTIDLGATKTGEIQIVDAMGRRVYSNEFNGKSKLRINSSNWEKGIYMIQMISNDEVSSSKIVIE